MGELHIVVSVASTSCNALPTCSQPATQANPSLGLRMFALSCKLSNFIPHQLKVTELLALLGMWIDLPVLEKQCWPNPEMK